jgi:hypothetical protein
VVLNGAGAALTVPNNPTQNNDTAISNAKRLTLGTAPLTITDGILQVAPAAALAIDTVVLSTNIDDTEIGYLAAADGGAVILANGGSVNIGVTVITAASTLRAGGGTITLGNNKIVGSVAGAVLTAAAGSPQFTLAANPNNFLILEQADLNLAANGTVNIGANSRVILTERGKITLNNGEGGKATARLGIAANGRLSGGFVGLTAPTAPETATGTQPVWSVAHRDAAAADVNILASGGAVALSKSGTGFTNN